MLWKSNVSRTHHYSSKRMIDLSQFSLCIILLQPSHLSNCPETVTRAGTAGLLSFMYTENQISEARMSIAYFLWVNKNLRKFIKKSRVKSSWISRDCFFVCLWQILGQTPLHKWRTVEVHQRAWEPTWYKVFVRELCGMFRVVFRARLETMWWPT